MKKYITISLITCALVSSNTSLSMFRLLRTAKLTGARSYHIGRSPFSLPEKNIFKASPDEIPTNRLEYLKDLHGRNGNIQEYLSDVIEGAWAIKKILDDQNNIAFNHAHNTSAPDLTSLKESENLRITYTKMYLSANENTLQLFKITHDTSTTDHW